jgi:hypothetical protein
VAVPDSDLAALRPTPFPGSPPPPRTGSGEGTLDLEVGALAQHVVTGPRQLVGDGLVGDHAVGFGPLALVVRRVDKARGTVFQLCLVACRAVSNGCLERWMRCAYLPYELTLRTRRHHARRAQDQAQPGLDRGTLGPAALILP